MKNNIELYDDTVYGYHYFGVTFQNGKWAVIKEFRSLKRNFNHYDVIKEFNTRGEAVTYYRQLKKNTLQMKSKHTEII